MAFNGIKVRKVDCTIIC